MGRTESTAQDINAPSYSGKAEFDPSYAEQVLQGLLSNLQANVALEAAQFETMGRHGSETYTADRSPSRSQAEGSPEEAYYRLVEIQLEAGWGVVEFTEDDWDVLTRHRDELAEYYLPDLNGLTSPAENREGGNIFVKRGEPGQMLFTLAHENFHRQRADMGLRNKSCTSAWYEVMPEAVAYLVSQYFGGEDVGAAKYIVLNSLYPRWIMPGDRQVYDDYVEENRQQIIDAALWTVFQMEMIW